jgi:hypothetical protein
VSHQIFEEAICIKQKKEKQPKKTNSIPGNAGQASSQQPPHVDRSVLPIPPAPFKGTIGLRANESTPSFPHAVTAPEGAPNVVLILMDNVGFGAASTFGGPINTPDSPETDRRRAALQPIPHHRTVQPDPRGADHWA